MIWKTTAEEQKYLHNTYKISVYKCNAGKSKMTNKEYEVLKTSLTKELCIAIKTNENNYLSQSSIDSKSLIAKCFICCLSSST